MLLAAPRARAQDLAGDVYADAKDIITELIERDLAESLSADMGCYSPKGLLKYFPNTLQSVYERNFGAVKDQLRTETIRFATNYAFECFRQSRTIPLDQFLPIVDFDPHNADTETCRKDTEAAGGPANYQAALAQQAAVRGEPYYPIDRCDPTRQKKQAAGATPEPRVVNALCPFVTALDSAAGGKAKDPLTLAANAAAASAFANWTYYVLAHAPQGAAAAGPPKLEDVVTGLEKMRGSVTEELVKRTSTGSFADDGLLIGFGAQGLNDQFELLANFEEVFALKASESTIAGALVFLLRSQAPRFTVNGTENSDLAALVRQPWFASLASDAGDAPGVTLARALLVSAGVVAHGVVKVSSSKAGVDFIWESGATSPPTFVGLGLGRLVEIQSMARHAAELERFVTAALGSKVDPAVAEVIVRATIGLVQFIDDTRAALKAIPRAADGSIDLVAVLDAILIPDKQTGFCPPPDPSEKDPKLQLSLCGILRQAAATADSENILRPILSAALNRDYRRLAVVATDAVFSRASIETICCGKPDSCTLAAELYGRLARSIVSYVLMPRGDEDQSIAARAAFKSAAIDVLREVGKRGGVE
ncbi:MAG TPA: hypothetical protein VEQ58_01500, partial [Polyangiaceae bacterium]|nr:hypothetical protein [Polyangiaceae bacterium]